MLTTRIIPCLDVKDGTVVKGVQFQNLRKMGCPVERASFYEESGADEIVLLDVSATLEGRLGCRATVARVRERLSIPLTVGGGVTSVERAEELLLAGADKVSVNTAAVESPGLVREMAERFGSQCVVVAIDADGDSDPECARVTTHSGTRVTDRSVLHWAEEIEALGGGEILLTSRDRDGTKSGYDLALLRRLSEVISLPVIASGGAAGPKHFVDAVEAGAAAVLAASIFHEGVYSVDAIKVALGEEGVEVRR